MSVDIPATATLLAQAAGRLVRRASDTGAVAVLDRRIADAPYGSTLLSYLPFPRECLVRQRSVAVEWLEKIRTSRDNAASAAGKASESTENMCESAEPA